jgi:hypothetical protein
MAGNVQIKSPGVHFAHFWGEGRKMLKLDPPGLILLTSGAKAEKYKN